MAIWNSFPGKLLMTFLISMVPVVELRGAIPIAVANGLPFWWAIPVSIVGNLVPVPFIIIFIKKYAFWGLFLFVAIPLPGTGAWTGALIAAMMDMKVKEAFPSILLGVLTAGAIVAFVTYGAGALLFG